MKTKKCIFAIVLLLMCSNHLLFAQVSLQTILEKCPDQELPFGGSKQHRFISDISFYITNKNNILYNKLYKNIQLTEYYLVRSGDEEMHSLFRKFPIPGSSNKLLFISMGGATDLRTDNLTIVSPTGEVLDQLTGIVCCYGKGPMHIKQCKVSAQGEIFISQLIPTESTSVELTTLKQFTGYRVDKTYVITPEGKFRETSSKRFKPQLYTVTQLEDEEYNLWDGTETIDNQ